MNIMILEDNFDRVTQFVEGIVRKDDKYYVANNVPHCTYYLNKIDFDIIFLDHDLRGVLESPGPGTGYGVTQWLAENPRRRPPVVVIHSMNTGAAEEMKKLLPDATLAPGIWARPLELAYLRTLVHKRRAR